ncbi:MAG: hypothetical protein IJ134_02670 [Bacilli bacterium]|nr:hypothetical protein [Bacilli bacterium]
MKKIKLLLVSLFVFIVGMSATKADIDINTKGGYKSMIENFSLNFYNPGVKMNGLPEWRIYLSDNDSNVYYCLDVNKVACGGCNYSKGNLLDGSAGFAYIFENGHSTSGTVSQADFDINQYALWLYARDYAGGAYVPNNSSYSTQMSEAIELYNNAKNFNSKNAYYDINQSDLVVIHQPDYSIDNTSGASGMSSDNNYYYKTIKINATKYKNLINAYRVELDSSDVAKGVYIANTDGSKISDDSGVHVFDGQNVTFRIYIPSSVVADNDNKYTARFYTNSNGFKIYKAHEYSSTSWNQRMVSYGYDVAYIKHASTASVNNKTGLKISKVDATGGEEIAGARLQLYKCSGSTKTEELVSEWTSSDEPHYESVLPGSYYLVETQAPSGYIKLEESSDCFEVTQDRIKEVNMKNKARPGAAAIWKVDGEGHALAGAKLQIRRKSDNSLMHEWVTGTSPLFINYGSNSLELEPGEYYVDEVETPDGYIKGERLYFEIDEYAKPTGPGFGAPFDFYKVVNYKKPSTVKIAKVNEKDEYIAGATLQILDSYGKPIEGMEYVSTTSPISVELDYGSYYLKETKEPSGYEINPDPVQFTVDHDGGIAKIVKVIDSKKPSVVKVAKVDEKDNFVEGATLKILDKDGNVVKVKINGKEVTEFKSTKDYITVEGLKLGEYFLQETEAPDGYVISEGLKPFSVTRDGGSVKYIKVTNEKTEIEISKIDPKGNYIKGAKLEILDEDGNTVQSFTSTDGPIVVKGLKAGKYYLKETEAPDGYEINDSPVEFFVSGDKKGFGQEISIVNDLTPEVPDTFAGASKLIYFIGTLAIVAGGFTLYKNKFAKARK